VAVAKPRRRSEGDGKPSLGGCVLADAVLARPIWLWVWSALVIRLQVAEVIVRLDGRLSLEVQVRACANLAVQWTIGTSRVSVAVQVTTRQT
jgi:hypothetical protein